jgi:hypothetical protein
MFNAILYGLGGYEYIFLNCWDLSKTNSQRKQFVKENEDFLEYSKIF